ncbi:hypothetical protein [Cellulosimicrobium cellulans]|nr:hypothetical protein [Cellulosimicrobium cellulans]
MAETDKAQTEQPKAPSQAKPKRERKPLTALEAARRNGRVG